MDADGDEAVVALRSDLELFARSVRRGASAARAAAEVLWRFDPAGALDPDGNGAMATELVELSRLTDDGARDAGLAAATARWCARLDAVPWRNAGLGPWILWRRCSVRSAPLFDPRSHPWSAVPGPWADEVLSLLVDLRVEPGVTVVQVRERMGVLRVFYRANDRAMEPRVDARIEQCITRLQSQGLHPSVADPCGSAGP